jgi:hypothetical protein
MATQTCPVCGMQIGSAQMAAHMSSGVAAHAVAQKGGGKVPFGGKQAPPFAKKGAKK